MATPSAQAAASQPKWQLWTGGILSALPVLLLVFSAGMKFARPAQVVTSFTQQFGYPENTLLPLGVVEILCTLLYVIPRTSVLGAILVTGYFGGAIATHVRVSDPSFVTPLILGILAWAGLFLRDSRLRALLPFRNS